MKGLSEAQSLSVGPIVIQEEISEISKYQDKPKDRDPIQSIGLLAINQLGSEEFIAKHIAKYEPLKSDVTIVNPRKSES